MALKCLTPFRCLRLLVYLFSLRQITFSVHAFSVRVRVRVRVREFLCNGVHDRWCA